MTAPLTPEQIAAMVADANEYMPQGLGSYQPTRTLPTDLAPHVVALTDECLRLRAMADRVPALERAAAEMHKARLAVTAECERLRRELDISFDDSARWLRERDAARADLARAVDLLDIATEYEQCACRGECGRTAHAFLAEMEAKR